MQLKTNSAMGYEVARMKTLFGDEYACICMCMRAHSCPFSQYDFPHFPNQIKNYILPHQLVNNLEGCTINLEEKKKKNPNPCYFKSKDDFKIHCMIPQGTLDVVSQFRQMLYY